MLFKSYLVAAFVAFATAKPIRKRASKLEFFGVNESGPEFGSNNIPGVLGTDVSPLSPSMTM
jgi:endoglucanase